MRVGNKKVGARLRIVLAPGDAFGPGKADLLDAIAQTGSISAAGRTLAMSYKRAWMLVEAMNAQFRAPLVVTAKGGPDGGGAGLTALGRNVLATFRRMEEATARATERDLAALQRMAGATDRRR